MPASKSLKPRPVRPDLQFAFALWCKRQLVIAGVTVNVGVPAGVPLATDEIRARLNLLEPGRRLSLLSIERNADEIQAYLRDRGYFNATVEHTEAPDPADATGTRRRVIYNVTPGPARAYCDV
jgi:outer membrane protein assembly factor BamA